MSLNKASLSFSTGNCVTLISATGALPETMDVGRDLCWKLPDKSSVEVELFSLPGGPGPPGSLTARRAPAGP